MYQKNRPTGCTIFHLFSIDPKCFSLTGCQWGSPRTASLLVFMQLMYNVSPPSRWFIHPIWNILFCLLPSRLTPSLLLQPKQSFLSHFEGACLHYTVLMAYTHTQWLCLGHDLPHFHCIILVVKLRNNFVISVCCNILYMLILPSTL